MVIVDQDRPLRARQLDHAGHDRAVGPDQAAIAVAPEHIRPGVAGVAKHTPDACVREAAPAQLARPRAAVGAAREPPAGEHADHAVGRAGLPKRFEHVGDCCLHLLVGVDDRVGLGVVDQADRQRETQLAALGRVALGALQPHPHHVQLGLRELTLDPEDQLIVEIPEVVDPIGVDHQRVGQPAVLKQPLRLRRGARQPRDLQAEDRADLTQANARDQLLEPPARLAV